MKKLMTILVVFALCGVAMAQPVTGKDSATKQIPLTNGEHDYINFTDVHTQGNSGLTYTVTNSQKLITGYGTKWEGWHRVTNYDDPKYSNDGHNIGKVYFTTTSQAEIDKYNAAHSTETSTAMTKVVVQFVGTYMDHGSSNMVKDYGIYLYNPETNTNGEFYSFSTGNTGKENYFELDPEQNFGVYYKTQDGKLVTTTDNWVGNYDKGNAKGWHEGENEITVYDENGEKHKEYTYKKFMCLLKTNDNSNGQEKTHWEFMLQTTLDSTYVIVNPDDFGEIGGTDEDELDTPSGQPLPGTLATLLIGSLCAAGLRKKNQK